MARSTPAELRIAREWSLTRPVPRDAVPADNHALLELASACPMNGDIGLCIDRAPDFFTLDHLQGDESRTGVVDGLSHGSIAGCIAVARRGGYVNGIARDLTWVGDLKVHPAHRGGDVADVLSVWAIDRCREMGGDDVPVLFTVLAGNVAMERRIATSRGMPPFQRFATIRTHSIPFLWRRRRAARRAGSIGLRIEQARVDDVEEMADLWRRNAPTRQLASVHDADSLARWIAAAPGLGIDSYWIARRGGRIAGFAGLWDQASFKQLRVTAYSPRLGAARVAINGVSRLVGATPLPPAGGIVRCLTAVHLCVPAGDADVLRTLVTSMYAARHGRGYACLNIGLDVRDPLASALTGIHAQPTDVHAYIATPAGAYAGPRLDDRPVHHEIALV